MITGSITGMNLTTLQTFRHGVYASFRRAADALFNTVDALLTEPTASSFAELSLSPSFERCWASLYEAFEDGRIDAGQMQQVFVEHLPLPAPDSGQRLLWAIDASGIARPQSRTSADRTALHVPNLPESHTPPITAGWQFSTLVVVPQQPSSWCYVLDSRRIPSSQTAGEVAVEQLREVIARLPEGLYPLLVADRYYPSAAFLRATGPLPLDKLLRCKKNRVFYRAAPAPTGKRGAPRKDGDRFACHDESTHGEPDEHWEGTDASGHPLLVERWNHLHLKQAREVELSVLRVTRLGIETKETRRKPRVSWFIEQGPRRLSLSEVRPSYQSRYGIEHSYRFEKQQLLWDQPRLRTPEQFERWTQIVAIVQNHLVLARPFVQAVRQPWERGQRAVTPQQVRRGIAAFLPRLGTPARPPQARGKSPGRSLHAVITPAPRYPVVKKAESKPKKRRKTV
jgi:DDE superfamily endonuclease